MKRSDSTASQLNDFKEDEDGKKYYQVMLTMMIMIIVMMDYDGDR